MPLLSPEDILTMGECHEIIPCTEEHAVQQLLSLVTTKAKAQMAYLHAC